MLCNDTRHDSLGPRCHGPYNVLGKKDRTQITHPKVEGGHTGRRCLRYRISSSSGQMQEVSTSLVARFTVSDSGRDIR